MRDFEVGEYISAVVDAEQARAEARAQTVRTLAQQWSALIVGALVLVLTSPALAALWVQARRQRLFAQWMEGRPWWQRHGVALLVCSALVALSLMAVSFFTTPDAGALLPPGEGRRFALRTPARIAAALLTLGAFTAALGAVSVRTDHHPQGQA